MKKICVYASLLLILVIAIEVLKLYRVKLITDSETAGQEALQAINNSETRVTIEESHNFGLQKSPTVPSVILSSNPISMEDCLKRENYERFCPAVKCHAIVSHDAKIIFVKHAKTGGTTIIRSLTRMICVLNHPGDKDCCKKDRCARKSVKYESLWDIPFTQRGELWKEYFTFAVVRNPWSRGRSYHSAIYAYKSEEKGLPRVSLEAFAKDPLSIARSCLNSVCYKKNPRYQLKIASHGWPQNSCTFTDGQVHVNYLLRTENLFEDMEGLIHGIKEFNNVSLSMEYYTLRNVANRIESSESEEYRKNICIGYKLDVGFFFLHSGTLRANCF